MSGNQVRTCPPMASTQNASYVRERASGIYKRTNVNYKLSSWLKSFNVSMASEREQRRLATDLTGGIKGEMMSFSFPDRNRGHIFQQAPCVWVNDLEEKILSSLEFNSRCYYRMTLMCNIKCTALFSEGRLTWHSGVIPEDEIWVKVGGGGNKGQG